MPTSLYNFQYVPLTGRLPGKSFVSQTEQAINGLAQYVYDNSTNYEAVKAIAQKAEEDSSNALEYSEEALDKAQTALETVGRAYIKTTSAVDLNDYFDSELLVILSTASTNLPASISGYLTVMSSDTHDYCMQVYIGIDGSVYKRTATISNNTPTFGAWSETPITLSSLQTILANYTSVDASNIGVNAQTDNSVAWGNAIGGGEIAEDEKRLITGGTVYPLSQNVAQNTSNIATNTADIVQNTGGISANSKRIGNIEKLLQGNLYDYQTDNSSAYTKSVPSGAMPYAGLEQIGGKTIVMNQLEPNPTTVYAQGSYAFIEGTKFYAGHKYYLSFDYGGTVGNYTGISVYKRTGGSNTRMFYLTADIAFSAIVTNSYEATSDGTADGNDGNCWLYVYLDGADSVTNIQIVDLTLMFGAGNEPSTPADYEAIFPSINAYNAGTLLSAGVTEVVSKDSNNATLQTIPIPTAIRNLEGYGWSAGTAYNYVDFERKVFVKNVGRIVIDGSSISVVSNDYSQSNGKRFRTDVVVTNCNYQAMNTQAISSPIQYDFSNTISSYTTTTKDSVAIYSSNQIFIFLTNTSYTMDSLNTYLQSNPITIYYELATPIETDISAYLTDDNLIQVESGGTLTFPNSNGTDYQIPVPSEETYMVDLQASLGG